MKCPLFAKLDHEQYNDLPKHDLVTVKPYWVKEYKANTKFNCDQSATNEYESAAFMMEPPPSVVPPTGGTYYNTYVLALEDVIARQLVDQEDAPPTQLPQSPW